MLDCRDAHDPLVRVRLAVVGTSKAGQLGAAQRMYRPPSAAALRSNVGAHVQSGVAHGLANLKHCSAQARCNPVEFAHRTDDPDNLRSLVSPDTA